jgi:hypothetical protein
LAEAAVSCLESHSHPQRVALPIRGAFESTFLLSWASPHGGDFASSWRDTVEGTEYGAYGIAILVVMRFTQFSAVERARRGGGFDYWLGYGQDEVPFTRAARLEVSGILHGTQGDIIQRVKSKAVQTQPSDPLDLPAYIMVVEFSQPSSHLDVR